MKYHIIYTARAKADIRELLFYYVNVLFQKNAASRFMTKLEHSVEIITSNPRTFRALDIEPWFSRGWRRFLINNYVVIYEVDDNTKTIRIMTVIYGGRDIEKILREAYL